MRKTLHLIRDLAWVAFSWAPRQVAARPRVFAIVVGVLVIVLGATYVVHDIDAPARGEGGAAPMANSSPTSLATLETPALPEAPPTVIDATELSRQLDEYLASHADLHCSVFVRIGDEVFDYHGNERYDTASIIKVDILATLLYQHQQAGTELSAHQRKLATSMITQSDNNATDELYGDINGPDGIDAANAEFGLTDTVTTWNWGTTQTSAQDQVRLWSAVMNPGILDESSSAWLRELTGSVVKSQAWGVSAAAEDDQAVMVKNGWDTRTSLNNRWVVNSVGMIESPDGTDVYMAILTENHGDYDSGVDVVEGLAGIVGAQL